MVLVKCWSYLSQRLVTLVTLTDFLFGVQQRGDVPSPVPNPAFRWSRCIERGRNDQNDPCLINPLCWYAFHATHQQSRTPLPACMCVCPHCVPVCVLASLCVVICVSDVCRPATLPINVSYSIIGISTNHNQKHMAICMCCL